MRRAGVRRPSNQIGIGWAGPTLIHAGTEAQKERYLVPLLAAEEIWCQLFSEPGAGSDLAGLSTRAERDGDEWVVTGQKVWTSFAHVATQGILLARTDPLAPKHGGISYFICPMDAPGVTVRPIVDMTGDHAFNEVFLDGVRLSPEHLVGEVNGGWALAKVTLGNERVSLSGEGALWGQGPTAGDLVDLVRRAGGTADRRMRQRLMGVWIEGEILRLIRLRTVSAMVAGRAPGPEASVRKALADDHGQNVMEVAKDLAGAYGMIDAGPFEALTAGGGTAGAPPTAAPTTEGTAHGWPPTIWSHGYLFGRALTIGGGTSEVQRNIIAERVLGLPS
jgi:alkylation response protein AidB-like acyl-CoA dehydrogenase